MAGEDARYCAFLRKQPCAKCFVTYGIEVHHPLWATTYSEEEARPAKAIPNAKKGKGQKSHDHFALPLCLKCHVPGIHNGGGHFAGTTAEEREAWEREQIPIHRNRYAMQSPTPAVPEPARVSRRSLEPVGWTVRRVLDLLRREAAQSHRSADAAAALNDVADVIEGRASTF